MERLCKSGRYALLYVLDEFISLEYLWVLNPAVCNLEIRSVFLSILEISRIGCHRKRICLLRGIEMNAVYSEKTWKLILSVNDCEQNAAIKALETLELREWDSVKVLQLFHFDKDRQTDMHRILSLVPNLVELALVDCAPVTSKTFKLILESSRNRLRKLALVDLPYPTYTCPINVSEYYAFGDLLEGLVDLTVSNCPFITVSLENELSYLGSSRKPQIANLAITGRSMIGVCNLEWISSYPLTKLSLRGRWHRHHAGSVAEWCTIVQKSSLTDIDLSYNLVNMSALVNSINSNVTKLSLMGCREIDDHSLIKLAAKCHKLTHLNIAHLPKTTCASSLSIVYSCDHLSHLELGPGQRRFTVAFLAKRWTDFTVIDFANNVFKRQKGVLPPHLSSQEKSMFHVHYSAYTSYCASQRRRGQIMRAVAAVCKMVPAVDRLKRLAIKLRDTLTALYPHNSCASGATDSLLTDIASQCSLLRELNLSDCSCMSDDGLCALLAVSSRLTALDCSDCVKLTDRTVHAITRHCYKIRTLNVRGCAQISPSALHSLVRQCLMLTDLHIGATVFHHYHGALDVAGRNLVRAVCDRLKVLTIDGVSVDLKRQEHLMNSIIEKYGRKYTAKEVVRHDLGQVFCCCVLVLVVALVLRIALV